MKPSILFTNLYLQSRSGSELHIGELAQAFMKMGWDVTCYTLVTGYPLQGELQESGVKIVEFGDEGQLADHYDVLFAQHHLISDYLISRGTQTFRKVIVSILGIYEMEALPSFAWLADAIIYVSEEAKLHYSKITSSFGVPQIVIPNYATPCYFEYGLKTRDYGATPKTIAVISNHIPKELVSLKELVSGDCCSIDFIGIEYDSVSISPGFIKKYDLVISIGRTIQMCFAAMVPCYCYDHFGGPGYISADEALDHATKNFSGRSVPQKKSELEIWDEINKGYSKAVSELSKLREMALEFWSFDVLLEKLLGVMSESSGALRSLSEEQYSQSEKIRLKLLCSMYRDRVLATSGKAQFFWSDSDIEFSEEDSLTMQYAYKSWIDFDLIFKQIGSNYTVRFDPEVGPCEVKLRWKHPLSDIDSFLQEDNLIFLHQDPQIIMTKDSRSLNQLHSFWVAPISEIEVNKRLNEVISETKSDLASLSGKSRSIKWLFMQLLREIALRVKRDKH